jgi:hypothetical protein
MGLAHLYITYITWRSWGTCTQWVWLTCSQKVRSLVHEGIGQHEHRVVSPLFFTGSGPLVHLGVGPLVHKGRGCQLGDKAVSLPVQRWLVHMPNPLFTAWVQIRPSPDHGKLCHYLGGLLPRKVFLLSGLWGVAKVQKIFNPKKTKERKKIFTALWTNFCGISYPSK